MLTPADTDSWSVRSPSALKTFLLRKSYEDRFLRPRAGLDERGVREVIELTQKHRACFASRNRSLGLGWDVPTLVDNVHWSNGILFDDGITLVNVFPVRPDDILVVGLSAGHRAM